MEKEYINPNNPVYISYAWANCEYPNIEKDVESLCEVLEANSIYYKRDKTNLCPYRWSIQKAEEEIGEGTAIIVVISERYLKSLHCMNEWHLMCENGKIWERVFPIVLEDANITDKETFKKYYKYYKEREQSLIEQQYEGIIPLTRAETEATNAGFYIEDLRKLYQYLANNNTSKLFELRKDNYEAIISQLKVFSKQISNNTNNTKPETGNLIPTFPITIPKGLTCRDEEVEELYDGIIKNRFFNLVGAGGSGKTSLTYLMIQKHQYDFNEIAYVFVNNSIKDEFVEQINAILGLKYRIGENFMYEEIITYLGENYNSNKPNLLVLDIYETSNETENTIFIDELYNRIFKNWYVLIISRKHFTEFKTKDLNTNNKKQDSEFVKELFLAKAGDKYNSFEDFDGLLKLIDYSPILAEQLGIYLNGLPKKSLTEIKKVFYGEYFRDEEFGESVSEINQHNKIVSFLKKQINYNKLTQNEQILLRHFILWQAEYIDYNIIKSLLKGVFAFDDDYKNALDTLYKRAILTQKKLPDGSSSYKLHGLLAESLREQIDISEQDYSAYLSNIEEIIKYNYSDFIPYADCIGNSLCEYDITEEKSFVLLYFVGIKFDETWKTDYAQKLYIKYTTIVSNKIENHPNNPDYKISLVDAYLKLACLQADRLKDDVSAETNFKVSIKILELLSKENPDFHSDLTSAYLRLVLFYKDRNNNELASKYFELATNKGNNWLSFKQDAPIYISYARTEKDEDYIASVVQEITKTLRKECIKYKIDINDINGGDDISEFERAIGDSKYTIIVYSKKYFCSTHCMYEYKQIKKVENGKRIICINSDHIDLRNTAKIIELYKFWFDIEVDIEFKNEDCLTELEKETRNNNYYKKDIKGLRNYFYKNKHYNTNKHFVLTKKDKEDFVKSVKEWFPKNTEPSSF